MSHLQKAALSVGLFGLLGTALMLRPQAPMTAPTPAAAPIPYDGVRAPEFPTGFPWLNSKPLSLRALRGKVVLLDFWTYGCINCMHILPDLKKLEEKYGNELVVISVHSAKFDTESEAKNVRNAVLRYKIEHPVLVDQNMKVWTDYAAKAWPTLLLIDPSGRVAGQVAGEGHYDTLDATIAQLIDKAKKAGELSTTPISLALERAKTAPKPLSFPGKVLAKNGKLYIADSGHNRIVIASSGGVVESIIGTGSAGLKDGDYAAAQFENPQGLTLDGDKLYVADTNNHALRVIDLTAKTVTTLAGNGQQAAYMAKGGVGRDALLSSPWDVAKVGNSIIMAMAGNHQIWEYNLDTKAVTIFAGSGAEARRDGKFADAAFAQTSGLVLQGDALFAADSESSTLRQLDLKTGTVKTVAGGDLFDFGDRDGKGDNARLQHPLGITSDGKQLYFVDTYNSKVKKLNPETREVTSLKASGFNEPGGLSFEDGTLYIADTNNAAVKSLDLATGKVTTLAFAGLKPPVAEAPAPRIETPTVIEAGTQVLAPGTSGKVVLDVKLPKGFHLNRESPLKLTAKVEGTGVKLGQTTLSGGKYVLPLELPFQAAKSGKGFVDLNAFVGYCNDGSGAICKVEIVKQRINFEIREGGAKELRASATLS